MGALGGISQKMSRLLYGIDFRRTVSPSVHLNQSLTVARSREDGLHCRAHAKRIELVVLALGRFKNLAPLQYIHAIRNGLSWKP